MASQLNTYSDVSSLAQAVQEDAIFVERDTNLMEGLVRVYRDRSGLNTRTAYQYNQGTAQSVGEADDLASHAFTPSALETLTPGEIGLQFFLTDSRMESDIPENIRNDAALELGYAARDKVESDLLGLFSSLTGGTIGAAGTTLAWGHVYAAASQVRNQIKNRGIPLNLVVHEYQWHQLAKAISNAGLTLTQIPSMLVGGGGWYVGTVSGAGINCYATTNISVDSEDDAYGAVFARDAIALDWRRSIRIEPERDASRRGWELNMSAVYAYGVWRPTFGVQIIADATAPTE